MGRRDDRAGGDVHAGKARRTIDWTSRERLSVGRARLRACCGFVAEARLVVVGDLELLCRTWLGCLLSAAPCHPVRNRSIASRPGPRPPTSVAEPASSSVHARSAHAAAGLSPRARRPRRPATPSTNVPTTRASPIAPGAAVEQVAVEHGQVGQLADLERAGLVEVVDVGGAGRERGQRVDELEPLVGQERPRARRGCSCQTRSTASSISSSGFGRRDAPVRAHGEDRAGRPQRAERVLPAPAVARGTGWSGSSIWPSWHGPQRLGVGGHVERRGSARCRRGG